jgi:1,4-dihydroxy-2-naphthoate octaprenyltransferase
MATVGARAAWWLAVRPATLTASAAPVLVGTAVAWSEGRFAAGPALAALLGAALLQVGANFANDVFDFERGADNADRLGPQRATHQGWVSAAQMKRAMWLAFASAALVGLYLTALAGWPVLALGLVSIAAAYLYTGGPRPYGYLGLGDVAVFAFFGPVAVVGTSYVQSLELTPLAGLASIPIGALATAILVVNNLRDIETDARAGKNTLAVRLGDRATRRYYLLLLAVAYAIPALLWWRGWTGAGVMLSWLSLPLALDVARRMRHERALPLNGCLVRTARLEVIFGLLFALGLAA